MFINILKLYQFLIIETLHPSSIAMEWMLLISQGQTESVTSQGLLVCDQSAPSAVDTLSNGGFDWSFSAPVE